MKYDGFVVFRLSDGVEGFIIYTEGETGFRRALDEIRDLATKRMAYIEGVRLVYEEKNKEKSKEKK